MKIHSLCLWLTGLRAYFVSLFFGIVKHIFKRLPPIKPLIRYLLPNPNHNSAAGFSISPESSFFAVPYVYPSSQSAKGYQLCSGAPPLLLAGIFYYPANPSATKSVAFAGNNLGSLFVEACRHLANRLRVDVAQLGGRIL